MITSTSNAKVKRLVNLKKKKKLRDEEGVFLVEGIRMFREVPKDRLVEVYGVPYAAVHFRCSPVHWE